MKIVLAVLLALTFGLSACSGADRGAPVAELRKALESDSGITKYGKLLETTKLNGQQAEFFGVKKYAIYFRAAIAMRGGWRQLDRPWGTGGGEVLQGLVSEHDVLGAGAVYSELKAIPPLPEGSILIFMGEADMALHDNGWGIEHWTLLGQATCPKHPSGPEPTPSTCLQALKTERNVLTEGDPSWSPRGLR